MISCPPHHHFHHHRYQHHRYHHRKPNCIPTTTSSSVHHNQHHNKTPPKPLTTTTTTTTTTTAATGTTTTSNDIIVRTHNFKSTSLLLQTTTTSQQIQKQHQIAILTNHIVQTSSKTTKKRTPRFPGSLSVPEEEEGEAASEESVVRALEVRRGVTAEVFKEAMMKKGKFGITYSTNLVGELGWFIDYVMIEAVALKRLPEFEDSSFNFRAKTVIEDLQVVLLIRWLKHNHCSYPKIANIICKSRGNIDSIRRLADWLKLIYVKGEFLGSTLMKAGGNILDRDLEELDTLVEYLESKGVRREWMGFVMSRCPQILSFTMEELKTRVQFYFDMGMNEKDFGTMVFDCPRVLGYYTLEEMNQKANYLKEFGLGDEEVGKLLAFKPELMCCSIEERWKPLVKYLYYLGISRDGMRRMLTIKPMVFCIDLEKTIVPKVRFFQDIGIQDDAIGDMLVKFPPLLTYSLYKKIRRVVIYLMTEAGVSRRDIAKTIASGPELLGCNVVNKLEMNVKYFLSLGIRHRQLGEMIADFPMLLRYSIDLLRPKYRYLRRNMVRPLQDLIEYPRFFSYSLEGRIIPRHKVLVENRINFKLRYMLGCSDEEFEKKVNDAVERRREFELGITNDSHGSEEDSQNNSPVTNSP